MFFLLELMNGQVDGKKTKFLNDSTASCKLITITIFTPRVGKVNFSDTTLKSQYH